MCIPSFFSWLASWVLFLLALTLAASAADPGSRTTRQRLETDRLRATHQARLRFAQERQTLPNPGVYEDYRAVIHIQAEDAPQTKGTLPEVLAAAKKTGTRVVIWGDHRGPKPDAWRGLREGVLFIAGSQESQDVLRLPEYGGDGQPLPERGLRFLSPVEARLDASSEGCVGRAISHRRADATLDADLPLSRITAPGNSNAWTKLAQDFRAYPDEFLGASLPPSCAEPGFLSNWSISRGRATFRKWSTCPKTTIPPPRPFCDLSDRTLKPWHASGTLSP